MKQSLYSGDCRAGVSSLHPARAQIILIDLIEIEKTTLKYMGFTVREDTTLQLYEFVKQTNT